MTAEIITFYSYKGGTGRSMHLANVAWILASNGKRVLMIDWDLEAPGLHRYFRPFLVDKDLTVTEGLIDLLWDFNAAAMQPVSPAESAKGWHEAYADLSTYTVAIDWPFPEPGCLDLVPSGKQGPNYSGNVNSFNWKRFYDDLGGGVFLESVKDRMRPEYDYVLIDSRTGVSDSAGVCTVQMPDALVVCFTGNNQSIDGCASVVESVRAQWSTDGRWPDHNRILPLLTRIDDSEKEKLDARRAVARATFQPYVAAIPASIDDYWRDIEVPYKAWYSYEEVLAVFGDRYKENSSLLASAEALTRILTRGLVTEVVPPGDADRERVIAQFAATEKARESVATQGGVEFRQVPPRGVPAPLIAFTVERQRHARFVRREDVLARLDEWLLGPDEVGWVVVTGGPGMGKSAILAAWLARREAPGVVVPHHFIRRQVANWDQPEVIAASLATQIEAAFPDLRDPTARPEGRLIELLGRVSQRLGSSERLVVVVDGLDEVAAEPGDNPLPRFLPHVVPPGIRFLCAMRPTYPHVSWIEARASIQLLDLDDRPWAASNEAVVRGFLEAAAAEHEPRLSAEVIATAVELAEGNVLYAVMLHDALQSSPASERRLDRIPRGIQGLIGEIWDRAAVHEGVRAGLGLLCAAQGPIPLDVIAELAGWGTDHYEERARFLREARQLLLEEPGSWSGVVAYGLRHHWVRALIAERLGSATIRAHHGELSRKLATWPAPTEPTARHYALRHGLIHRVEAGAWADAWRLAADTSFLEAKYRELGADEAEADVGRAAERCRVSGDEALRGRFDDLARALGRESHWLRAAPEATGALVWNRLRQSGWSADEIDQQLQLPARATFLRVQHVAPRESSALVGDHAGHSDRVNACAVTRDGRRAVSASWDNTLKVWDLDSGQALATLQGHASRVLACAVTPDGRRVVSASGDNTLKVWDLDSGQALATLQGHAHGVNACAVTPDGRRVVSASGDNTLKVWDLDSGQALATLQGHAHGVNACAVTPDGRRVVSASEDNTLKVWDLDSGQALVTLRDHADRVRACVVTPDGRRVVSASEDRTLKVWDLDSGQALATLQGHADRVLACVVTPDGRRVVSASWDQTLKVWDLAAGECLLTHHANSSYSAVAATTTAIVAGDAAGVVWFLDWPWSSRITRALRTGSAPEPPRRSHSDNEVPRPRSAIQKHTILFLAANPSAAGRLALDREARAIQNELNRSGFRENFSFETRLALEPLDLLRYLRKLRPTVVHFSGHGGESVTGLFFQGSDGRGQRASTKAIEEVFGVAGSSVRLVVLNGCYDDVLADALLTHIACVVGVSEAIHDDAARSFAIGFYGGLGDGASVAGAYEQGIAAIHLGGLHDSALPQLMVRAGVDASQLVLAADLQTIGSVESFVAASPSLNIESPASASSSVDIGIITIRDDELRALLGVFPSKAGTFQGASREYTLRYADAGNGEQYTVAVLRQVEQGNAEAQDAARDLIEDLAPRLVLVVGIAGGAPSDDLKLGDVILSTRIEDFTVEAREFGQSLMYAATSPVEKALAASIANLAVREDEMGDWTADLPPQPPVPSTRKGQLYGPLEWQRSLRATLEHHYGKGATPRAPVYAVGTIASSDRLVKDPEQLITWLTTARNVLAVEMESGGVYRAAQERCPMLAIRGISEIVGLKRADAWTKYACAVAAAFTRAFLRTRPIPSRRSMPGPD